MAKPSEDSQEAPAGQNGAPATAQSEADHGKADDAIVESDTDQAFRVRIELPAAPASELQVASFEDIPGQQQKSRSMLAICTPTERVSELKNLVKSDPEAFWIGAFSFIRVPPETQASPAPSKGHGAKPYDDWVDVASIFSGPEYQDPNTARILKVVSVAFDALEARSHLLRANDVFNNRNPGLLSRQNTYRGPSPDKDAVTLDQGISYYPLLCQNAKNAPPTFQKDDALASDIALRKQLSEQPSMPRAVVDMSLSAWNPPTQANRLRGQLFYLSITTLEKEQLHVVSSASGFYIDKTSTSSFNPSPRSNKVYPSIFALLADKSTQFRKSMKQLTSSHVPSHTDMLATAAAHTGTVASPWMVEPPTPTSDLFRTQIDFLTSGFTVSDVSPTQRDWNEELVLIRQLPSATLSDKLNRERFHAKVQDEMNNTAVRTLIKIVHGDISLANPGDPPELQSVVHDNLLFVPAKDALGTFTRMGGNEVVRSTVAKDVHNAQYLSQLDIEGLHLSPSLCIDYLGRRWFVQTVLPGLLGDDREEDDKAKMDEEVRSEDSKEEPQTGLKVLYGAVDSEDPEKKFAADKSFEPLAKRVAEHLNLAQHDVRDNSGRTTSLWLSGETKGVRGQDGHHYLLDLYRLTPVDVAFLENDLTGPLYGSPYAPAAEESAVQSKEFTYPHRFVLLRREALTIYTQRHLLAHRMQSQPNQNEEDNALKEEVRNKFDRLEKDLACCSDTPKNDKGLPAQVSFNPDAFVDRLSEDGKVAADENAPSTQHIRRAAAYVRDQAIRNLLTEALVDTLPADGQAWTDSMHGKGINMRYLGLVASKATVESLSREDRPQPDKPRLQAIVKGLEREMVFRATKFVLRQALEQLDVLEAPAFLSHFLNCLLGFSITSSPRPDTSSLSNTILPQKLWTSLTSDVLHAQIRDQVARRFRYSLAEDWFATDLRKPQLLREVCTRCGIQLQLRQYIFEPASQTDTATQSRASLSKVSGGKSAKAKAAPPVALPSTPQTTFNPEDIVQVYPIVKSTRHESEMCQQYYLTGLEAIRAGDLAYGESMANDALSFLDQIFGTVHPELAGKHHHLAKVFATIAQNTLPRIQLYEQSKRITDETEMQKIRETAELSTDEDCATLNNQVQGIIQSATSMFRHSLVLTERTSGPLSFPTALRMQKLGAHEGNHGDVGLGIELVRRALSILRIIYGEDHHLAASWTLNLASMVAKHSGHTASIPFFEEAVRLVLNTEGPESDSAAVAFTSLAQMQFLAGHVDAALATSRKAEEAFKAAFGAEDARTNDAHQLTAHIELVQQHKAQGEQAKVERLAKRLGVKEDRAKHLLERSLRSETGTASTTASTSSVTTEDSSVSNLPLDDIVNFVTGGARASSSSSASGKTSRRSGPKGKGPARRKK